MLLYQLEANHEAFNGVQYLCCAEQSAYWSMCFYREQLGRAALTFRMSNQSASSEETWGNYSAPLAPPTPLKHANRSHNNNTVSAWCKPLGWICRISSWHVHVTVVLIMISEFKQLQLFQHQLTLHYEACRHWKHQIHVGLYSCKYWLCIAT